MSVFLEGSGSSRGTAAYLASGWIRHHALMIPPPVKGRCCLHRLFVTRVQLRGTLHVYPH